MKLFRPGQRKVGGFTLMELILAIGIAAIVLGAVTAAFFSAIRLRERTAVMIDEAGPVDHAVATIRKDIFSIIGSTTNSVLAGDFKVGDVTTVGMSQNVAIEMYTTTGRLKDTEPWGEIQRVTYSLRAPASQGTYGGKDLVRSVTRNLLATIVPSPEEQWLLGDVDKLEFECYHLGYNIGGHQHAHGPAGAYPPSQKPRWRHAHRPPASIDYTNQFHRPEYPDGQPGHR